MALEKTCINNCYFPSISHSILTNNLQANHNQPKATTSDPPTGNFTLLLHLEAQNFEHKTSKMLISSSFTLALVATPLVSALPVPNPGWDSPKSTAV